MTIDEVIKFCNEKSKNIKLKAEPQVFIDIADWLELLKWYQQGMEDIPTESGVLPKDVYKAGYNKGVDDLLEKQLEVLEDFKYWEDSSGYPIHTMSEIQRIYKCKELIKRVAEQLKDGDVE